jgi:hypothetical protein
MIARQINEGKGARPLRYVRPAMDNKISTRNEMPQTSVVTDSKVMR